MPHGQFGENLTLSGLDESVSCIGDHIEIGTALFAITQPRVPCFKLGIRLNDPEIPKLFTKSLRTGFYLKVLREGVIQAGNEARTVQPGRGRISVREIFQSYFSRTPEATAVLERALEVEELSATWRSQITRRLSR
jgi:MOSC domain-containing protein YiiM